MSEKFLQDKLLMRQADQTYRSLHVFTGAIDLYSNDYLGIATNHSLALLQPPIGVVEDSFNSLENSSELTQSTQPVCHDVLKYGSTGSRLLAGNSRLAEQLEADLADFHQAEGALLFNSGYDANLGLISTVSSKQDHIIYDALAHASIRDGIKLSYAKGYSFKHNDLEDLRKKLLIPCAGERFIITESVFSMDGDLAPLEGIVALANMYNAKVILDEAHGIGVIGDRGEGLAQSLQLHKSCFARVYTYGKAMGCHGALVAGSSILKEYLINYCRSFIYTTALPDAALAVIQAAYHQMPGMAEERNALQRLIDYWQKLDMPFEKLPSTTPIQGILVPGVEQVRLVEKSLQAAGFGVKAILSPTVPAGTERLRVVLHSFNTIEHLNLLQKVLKSVALNKFSDCKE